MMNSLKCWKGAINFIRFPRQKKRIVFYSEGGRYWPYFESIIDSLINTHGCEVLYVTSDPEDRILVNPLPGVIPFLVGKGGGLISFFETLAANVVVMTTPDLHQFHIKKSPRVGCFAYLHHSVVSTHMIYREGAFDYFDAILCVGPHHEAETRSWEAVRKLPRKKLFRHGYGLIDRLADIAKSSHSVSSTANPSILLAPSWGARGLLETIGEAVCEAILSQGFALTVRPHPRTDQLRPDIRQSLTERFGANPSFQFDQSDDMGASLLNADLMISDWSGIAFEYAFGLLRPVLFIDVPRKINNPAYGEIDDIPLEVSARTSIGRVLAPSSLDQIGLVAREMIDGAHDWQDQISRVRELWLYNFSRSGAAGAQAILDMEKSLNV